MSEVERFDALSAVTGRGLDVTSAVYAGWDGRMVKFGQTVAARGAHQRLKAYVTHNPLFRFVAVIAHDDPGWMEGCLLTLHFDDRAFDRTTGGRGDVEWFKPTAPVLATVTALRNHGRPWLDKRWPRPKTRAERLAEEREQDESDAAIMARGDAKEMENLYILTAGRRGRVSA